MAIYTFVGLIIIMILWVFITRIVTVTVTKSRISEIEDSQSAPVAIVFGAGLQRNGSPTPLLEDRVVDCCTIIF